MKRAAVCSYESPLWLQALPCAVRSQNLLASHRLVLQVIFLSTMHVHGSCTVHTCYMLQACLTLPLFWNDRNCRLHIGVAMTNQLCLVLMSDIPTAFMDASFFNHFSETSECSRRAERNCVVLEHTDAPTTGFFTLDGLQD